MSDLEVCFVSYHSGDALRAAIRSVRDTIPGATIAVVEHGATALDDEQFAADDTAGLRVEHDPSNPGFATGCNRLAAGSSATWLLFLNPDATVHRWPGVERLTPGMIHGPHHPTPRETAAHSGTSYTIADEIRRSWLRRPAEPPSGTGFVSGAALLVERTAFDRVGGFDEGYFMYYEDIDFCLHANEAGIGTRLLDGWMVEHAGAHAARRDFGRSLTRSYESGCRFHAGRDEPLWAWRTYVLIDSVLRAGAHLVRRDANAARAYAALARRSAVDMVTRRAPGVTEPTAG